MEPNELKGTGMEDDDREVAWAPDKIRMLQREVHILKNILFTDLQERITELDKRLTTETERINDLRERIGWVQDTGGEAQTSTDRVLDALNERLSQIESRLNAYGVPMVKGEYRDRTDDDFSAVIGRDSEHARPLGGVVSQLDETERFVLRGAAERVEKYMTGHFSAATIEGILRALIGEDVPRATILRDGDSGALHGSTEVKVEGHKGWDCAPECKNPEHQPKRHPKRRSDWRDEGEWGERYT